MRFSWLNRFKLPPIPRDEAVSARQVNVSLLARFFDELLGGLPDVLMPTIRTALGLTYVQVSLLRQVLDYVGAVIEPLNGVWLDVGSRRWMMAWGAVGLGITVALIGLSPAFWVLLLAYAIYGAASGPLAHTADVVLVESHPQAEERIYTRSTLIDTVGALLAPLLVAAAFWLRLPWRGLLLVGAGAALVYGVVIWRTQFVKPAGATPTEEDADVPYHIAIRRNVQAVLRNPQARLWLLFLFAESVAETRHIFVPLWLQDSVGMTQAQIGLYKAVEFGVGIVALLWLDRLLMRFSKRRVLQAAIGLTLLVIPAWLYLPGVASRFLLSIPLGFSIAFLWPIARPAALASTPGKAGAVVAVSALVNLIPLPLFVGWLAEATTPTQMLLWVQLSAFGLMGLITFFIGENS